MNAILYLILLWTCTFNEIYGNELEHQLETGKRKSGLIFSIIKEDVMDSNWMDYGKFEPQLEKLLKEIMSREMPGCSMTIVYDELFENKKILLFLSQEPYSKLVLYIMLNR